MRFDKILDLTLSEFGQWCKKTVKNVSAKEKRYFEKIIKEIDNFDMLSCGHLKLSRPSNTLSGGELQRVRICALLNSDVSNTCFLLDEPSSGLHYSDIEKLGRLLRNIVNSGNTVIIVEHNKKLLQYCDYIVDLGPNGGSKGGEILFADYIDNIAKYKTLTTDALLAKTQAAPKNNLGQIKKQDFIKFHKLAYNNLKNIDAKFPRNFLTVVCGVSGSGKSTFVKKAVLNLISKEPDKYGFNQIDYLGQTAKKSSSLSNVATILNMSAYIAQLYAKKSNLSKNIFMKNSKEGKCKLCGGTGKLYSSENEFLGICDCCDGLGFDAEALDVKINGLNIYDIYNTSIEQIGAELDDKKLISLSRASSLLGVGYLNFSRTAKSLSKGELQRLSLLPVILEEEKNRLIILDEPSKGLHQSDSMNLIGAMKKIVEHSNTLLVVEHNPELIGNADYIVEFGGTGSTGGYLLYQGHPDNISGTPTAKMLENAGPAVSVKKNLQNQKIKITDEDNSKLEFAPFKVYRLDDLKTENIILKAAKRTMNDFLSVAIPNNSMFSKTDGHSIDVCAPIIFTVDFHEKIKYNIYVCDALGITDILKTISPQENHDAMSKYVFDIKSSTGKCITCRGFGTVNAVDEKYFISNGDINSECKKFLKNSTNYQKIIKHLKKDGIDFSKKISGMNPNEKKSLFWGSEFIYETDGKDERWEGIIPLFFEYHKYYPEKNSKIIYDSRQNVRCPMCNGKRVKGKYNNMKCCGMDFDDWMSMPVDDILSHIKKSKSKEYSSIIHILETATSFGLGKCKLSDDLCSLPPMTGAKIKLLSLYINQIYGAGILIRNTQDLAENDYSQLKKIADGLCTTNTIWIA